MTAEHKRLEQDRKREENWKRWGPYLSERQWGTVREDYSDDQDSWSYFTHEQSRSRAYRWGEDGLLGWTDRQCRLCFAPALWNGQDPILKERLFGLNGREGSNGEDVKENYYYLDATPTYSYTKSLYKYPQKPYPYQALVQENFGRDKTLGEVELADLGMFENNAYFDIQQEVAKRSAEDLLWKLTATNRGDTAAPLTILPQVWLRKLWNGEDHAIATNSISLNAAGEGLAIKQAEIGNFRFYADCERDGTTVEWLFTDNQTNKQKIFGAANSAEYTKDAFHRYIVDNQSEAVNPAHIGTKAAACIKLTLQPGESVVVRCRMHAQEQDNGVAGLEQFDTCFAQRIEEADAFYNAILPERLPPEDTLICRQGYAGLLWTKQFYEYIVNDWMDGDCDEPAPPNSRRSGRNHDWRHFHASDILSMPDKWEYPWFAAWDTAFHMIPFVKVDPDFAKSQLLLLLREWYMHPNGQLPAYEWNLSDVNPPVHAWAVWRVYKIADPKGKRDLLFLEKAFQKLLLNFTWWVNRKDTEGRHVFGGGFLGLDNIGVFDRSKPLPGGGRLHQADGTAWMGSYCLLMLSMALELAQTRPAYEDIASKFFEHFVNISEAINELDGNGLWDEEDGFYYDQLVIDHEKPIPLKVRSLVGLLPMIAVTVLDDKVINALPGFKKRMDWFLENKPDLATHVSETRICEQTGESLRILSLPSEPRLKACLQKLVDENEFLSPYGVRSLSKYHDQYPFEFSHAGEYHTVAYVPGESDSWMFGGNSNWRGPIWFPTNYLIIEALERYHHFYGSSLTIEAPAGSGNKLELDQVAELISERLVSLFQKNQEDIRPALGHGPENIYKDQCHWQNLHLFYEYFHAETGRGLGASHQTGWTSLVVRLIRERQEKLSSHKE